MSNETNSLVNRNIIDDYQQRIRDLEAQLAAITKERDGLLAEYVFDMCPGSEKSHMRGEMEFLEQQNRELREAGMELCRAYVGQIESEYGGTSLEDNLMRVADKFKTLTGGG